MLGVRQIYASSKLDSCKVRPTWTPRPGDRLVRHPRRVDLSPVTVVVDTRKVQHRALASPMIVIYVFIGLIIGGTILLSLPFTHYGGGFAPFMDALFTATSAVTVTGLVVQDTARYWTLGGQLVIGGLIFVGGLGFMSLATFALVAIGQRVTLPQRMLLKESFGGDLLGVGSGGLVRLTVGIVIFAVGAQLLAFVILAVRFWFIYTPDHALLMALFHSISAFNNAGFIFVTEEGGMTAFQDDGTVIGVTAGMIFLGAISYGTVIDLVTRRRFRLFGLTTKLVLLVTAVTILVGIGTFLVFEYQNPNTLGPLPVSQKLSTAVFESISGRTAGFTTLDYSKTEDETNFMMTGLMFIGGASASVAGGIKVNTLAIILVAILSTIRGRTHASVFGREIPSEQVRRALVLGAIATAIVFSVIVALSITDGGMDFLDLFFESVSAFGTVGLSTGITPMVSELGQLVLVLAMFVGRLGPFTIGIAMAQSSTTDRYRFVQERVTIG